MADGYFHNGDMTTHYRVEGEGPVVAFIHGVGSRLESWNFVLDAFGGGYRVLRHDLRGFGDSTKTKGRYEVERFADDFSALLDHLGIAKCHVVGFSLGGLIAQSIALNHPDRVDRLVLCSTLGGVGAVDKAFLNERYEALKKGVPAEHFRRSIDLYFSPEFQKAYPERILSMEADNRKNDPECYAAAYRIIAETDLVIELHKVRAKALVLTGEHDRASPQMAAAIAEAIPDSELHIFDGLRHNLLVENPELLAQTIRTFLES